MNKADLIKNGKFYNTEKATLLLISEYFSSYGHKRRAWYKSATGVYFQTFQHIKVSYNLKAFQDLTVERQIDKEVIIGEEHFETIRGLFETVDKDGKIGIDSGVNSYCTLRNQSTPQSKLGVVNKPKEFQKIIEV